MDNLSIIQNALQHSKKFTTEQDDDGMRVKDTNADGDLMVFAIVEKEERFIYQGTIKTFSVVRLYENGVLHEAVKIPAEKLLESKTYISLFGQKPFVNFGSPAWEMFKLVLQETLLAAPCIEIYSCTGWMKENHSLVVGKYKIDIDSVTDISNGKQNCVIKPQFTIEQTVRWTWETFSTLSKDTFIGCSLLSYYLLSLLKPRFYDYNAKQRFFPSFVCIVIGVTGSHKSSTIIPALNPYGTDMCAFTDTKAAIRNTYQENQAGCTIIDDYTVSSAADNEKFEFIIRLSGDATATGKLVRGGSTDKSVAKGMAVLTGERYPVLKTSSYWRMLALDFEAGSIDTTVLTQLQKNTDMYAEFIFNFIQYLLHLDDFEHSFIERVKQLRTEYRETPEFTGMQDRYYEMYGWLATIWDLLVHYLNTQGISPTYDFHATLRKHIYKQYLRFSDDPIRMFHHYLNELIASNSICVVDEATFLESKEFCIYETTDELFIKSGVVFKQVVDLCKQDGKTFPCTERGLRNKLFESKLLKQHKGKNTQERKLRGNISCSGYCLYKNLFNQIGGKSYEQY